MDRHVSRPITTIRSPRLDDILQQGSLAVQQQRPDEAERIARTVLARNPKQPDALHLLGVALLAQRRAREAIAPLQDLTAIRADPVIQAHLGKALRLAGRSTEALTWLERACAHEPVFAPAFHERGILLAAMQRFEEAEAVLKRGVAVAPHDSEIALELGGVFISRADPANAKLVFARVLAQTPGHPRALHGFGTALLYEGDYQRAAERFRQVLARYPSHERARLDLGHCLLELGRFDEAVGVLRAMVQAAPQFYSRALKLLVSSGRGCFWLRPSAAAAFLHLSSYSDTILGPFT
jgi:Flp pilus assembly protein TadD